MSLTPPAAAGPGRRVIPADVIGSVRKASDATGVNFAYLMAQAARESSFRPDVSSSKSSASGLFQFIQGTWLQLMKKHGAKYGYGDLAAQIRLKQGGGYVVDNAKAMNRIMALRKNPELSSMMAAEYARGNKMYLEKVLGREVAPADLYIAHFLGPGGAAQLLKAHQEDGARNAAELFPKAAQSNKTIFYHSGGEARTVAALYEHLEDHVEEPIRRYAALQNETGAVIDPVSLGPTGDSPSFGMMIASASTALAKSAPQATETAVAILAILETSARSTPIVPDTAADALKTLKNDIAPPSSPSLMAAINGAAKTTQERTQQAENLAARTLTAMNGLIAGEPPPPAPSLMAALDGAAQTTQAQTRQAKDFASRTMTAMADFLPKVDDAGEPVQPAPSLMAALDGAAQTTQVQTRQAKDFATRTMTAMADFLPKVDDAGEPAQPAPSLMAALDGAAQTTQVRTEQAENFAARTMTAMADFLPEKSISETRPHSDTLIASSQTGAPKMTDTGVAIQSAPSLIAALDGAVRTTQERTGRAENFAARTMTAMTDYLPERVTDTGEAALSAPSLIAALDGAALQTQAQSGEAVARTMTAMVDTPKVTDTGTIPAPAPSLVAALEGAARTTQERTVQAENLAARTMTAMADYLPDLSAPVAAAQPAPTMVASLDDVSAPVQTASSEKTGEESFYELAALEERYRVEPPPSYDDPNLSLVAAVATTPVLPIPERVAQAYVQPPEDAAAYRDKLLASGAIPATALTPPPLPKTGFQPLPPRVVVAATDAARKPSSAAEDFEKLAKLLQG